MADYHTFTVTRTTEPDPASLLAQLRASDPTVGVQHLPGTQTFTLKKATTWTANQITAAQTVLETAPATSPQLTAQAIIDSWDIPTRALVLTLIDQINLIRSKLSPPLGAVTPQQALQAIRDKAGTLS
jgi:hypothetical protein